MILPKSIDQPKRTHATIKNNEQMLDGGPVHLFDFRTMHIEVENLKLKLYDSPSVRRQVICYVIELFYEQ